ncbi:MAG: SprT-like domain-containing protein [Pseudomonadota bacterium]
MNSDDCRGNRKFGNDASIDPGKPTYEAYGALQFAFEYFNRALFHGRLPDVLITLARKRNVLGYFSWSRFENSDEIVSHEISRNPQYMKDRGDRDVLSTLVHEMAHLWRHEFGPLNTRGGKGAGSYHDVVWADKMDEIGLPPRNIGCGKGTRTGYLVTHTIEEGGLFDKACKALLENGFQIDWHDAPLEPRVGGSGSGDDDTGSTVGGKRRKDKVKFTCPELQCGLNAWAKASAQLTCTSCRVEMVSELAPQCDDMRFPVNSSND